MEKSNQEIKKYAIISLVKKSIYQWHVTHINCQSKIKAEEDFLNFDSAMKFISKIYCDKLINACYIQYPNSAKYFGYFKNNQFYGNGKLCVNDNILDGKWENEECDGRIDFNKDEDHLQFNGTFSIKKESLSQEDKDSAFCKLISGRLIYKDGKSAIFDKEEMIERLDKDQKPISSSDANQESKSNITYSFYSSNPLFPDPQEYFKFPLQSPIPITKMQSSNIPNKSQKISTPRSDNLYKGDAVKKPKEDDKNTINMEEYDHYR